MIGLDVSRETAERLAIYRAMLEKWNKRLNLVAPGTIAHAEKRHFEDCLQIAALAQGDWNHWADLGSGGGFPGLVVAMANPEKSITLIEADSRKAGFLRAVAREAGVSANVVVARIEQAIPQNADVISARALAPLDQLFTYVDRHMAGDGTALLMKGGNFQSEIDAALANWRFDCEIIQSETHPDGVILRVKNLMKRHDMKP